MIALAPKRTAEATSAIVSAAVNAIERQRRRRRALRVAGTAVVIAAALLTAVVALCAAGGCQIGQDSPAAWSLEPDAWGGYYAGPRTGRKRYFRPNPTLYPRTAAQVGQARE